MARVYHEIIVVPHVGEFKKVVNVAKDGCFTITYPMMNTDEGDEIVVEKIYGYNLIELEKEWNHKIQELKFLYEEYEYVILYQFEKGCDWENGSGFGFLLNWGVFKKIVNNNGGFNNNLYYVRGQGKIGLQYKFGYGSKIKKDWKQMKWTIEREKFFEDSVNKLTSMFTILNEFFNSNDIEDTVDKMVDKGTFLLG